MNKMFEELVSRQVQGFKKYRQIFDLLCWQIVCCRDAEDNYRRLTLWAGGVTKIYHGALLYEYTKEHVCDYCKTQWNLDKTVIDGLLKLGGASAIDKYLESLGFEKL